MYNWFSKVTWDAAFLGGDVREMNFAYGFSREALKFMQSYLKSRKQRAKVNKKFSFEEMLSSRGFYRVLQMDPYFSIYLYMIWCSLFNKARSVRGESHMTWLNYMRQFQSSWIIVYYKFHFCILLQPISAGEVSVVIVIRK